jgi:hypothetical protein
MIKAIGRYRYILVALMVQMMPLGAVAGYDVKVSISFPPGSAGSKNTAIYPSGTKTSPCNSPDFDALSFQVTYSATNDAGVVDRDVYFMLHNPEARGAPRFMVLRKQGLGSSLTLAARNSVAEVSPSQDVYMLRSENLSSAGPITESLVSHSVSAQSAAAGIWQLIGIVADGTNPAFSFDDPGTWNAWDVATVMLRKPWMGYHKSYCE